MKVLLVASLCLSTVLAVPSIPESKARWSSFKQSYNKLYDVSEESRRLAIFSENMAKIEQHNKLYNQGLTAYKMGINQFADMTSEEFVAYLRRSRPTPTEPVEKTTFQRPSNLDLPEKVDWRKEGVVSEVKNQGACGSCWAFSTTGSLESQLAIKTGKIVSLSEQELVDCSARNSGCNGGLKNTAFDYVKQNGLTSEQEYPYEASDRNCRRGSKPEAIRNSNHVIIPSESEDDLASAVATVGPIGVAVDASPWHLYESGILDDSSCRKGYYELNHEVLAVGYEDDYWIVKNSWGAEWGEDGYIKLARNKNTCGIATDASYPVL